MANMVILTLYSLLLSRAFRKGRIVLLIYVELDCDQLAAWSVVSGGI
jgi:hypothetical protein